MFSVYGKAGRIFRGAMEELRHVGPVAAASKAHAVAAVGLDPEDQNPARFSALVHPQSAPDIAHRTALAAYEQVRKPDHPRQPVTQGFTIAIDRRDTSRMHATRAVTTIRTASWKSSRRPRSLRSWRARSISSSNGGHEKPPSLVLLVDWNSSRRMYSGSA